MCVILSATWVVIKIVMSFAKKKNKSLSYCIFGLYLEIVFSMTSPNWMVITSVYLKYRVLLLSSTFYENLHLPLLMMCQRIPIVYHTCRDERCHICYKTFVEFGPPMSLTIHYLIHNRYIEINYYFSNMVLMRFP